MALDPATVETNIVTFAVDDAVGLVRRLADRVELQASMRAGRGRSRIWMSRARMSSGRSS